MRHLVSGLAAAITALVVGTLIAGAAESAHAADLAKAQAAAAAQVAEVAPAEQASVDAAAYRTQLAQAMRDLQTAYDELAARDAAYRALLDASQQNVATLQSANAALRRQLEAAAARIDQLQLQQATGAVTPPTRRVRDDDD